ncbi:MAG TPA: hypothetical protein VN894_19065 [Polyangiaceae bacterium]|nr:hypothetical protein [Polyangiaceae bacterium]
MFLRAMTGLAASLALLSCSGVTGVSESVVVNERMFLRMGDTLVPEGAGCSSTSLPASEGAGASSGSSGSGNGDISVTEGAEGNFFVVRVFSGQSLLALRRYTVSMLRSGQVDEFTVASQSGATYVFRYWGGSCTDLDASSPDS